MLHASKSASQADSARPRLGPIIFACDEGYSMQLATTLRSIVETNRSGWPLEFHVLCTGFGDDLRKKIANSLCEGSASISWVSIELEMFAGYSTIAHCSKMTYARLLIGQVLPVSVSRVLYLDADLLVLGDLGALWRTELAGSPLAAVRDHGIDRVLKSNNGEAGSIPWVENYFNAGVLLIDLDRWREERIAEAAVDYLTSNPHSPFSDQDALNVACDKKWIELDPRWNFQNHYYSKIAELPGRARPWIVHFVTSRKPWLAEVLSPNAVLYDSFRSRTCFARSRWAKVRDGFLGVWAGSKATLRNYALVRRLWGVIRPASLKRQHCNPLELDRCA